MKPGDLVVGEKGVKIFSCEDEDDPGESGWIDSGIPFLPGEVGTVLRVFPHTYKTLQGKTGTENFFKILTPRGIGWVFESHVRKVNGCNVHSHSGILEP
jgi:hypothetical protein